jgi:hypothetical protein
VSKSPQSIIFKSLSSASIPAIPPIASLKLLLNFKKVLRTNNNIAMISKNRFSGIKKLAIRGAPKAILAKLLPGKKNS